MAVRTTPAPSLRDTSIAAYRAKRDFTVMAEPAPAELAQARLPQAGAIRLWQQPNRRQ